MTARTPAERYEYLRNFGQQQPNKHWRFVLELITFGIWSPEEMDNAIDAALDEQEAKC
ncbi:MAG: hypothetical protein RIS35_2476 [Pseudomonadota bacterium]|jgi:hypothetical protein